MPVEELSSHLRAQQLEGEHRKMKRDGVLATHRVSLVFCVVSH